MNIKPFKWPLISVFGAGALLLLFLIIAPSFIDSEPVANKIGHEIEALTGQQMIYGEISVGLISGAEVVVHGIAIKNDPDGSANYFFRADKLVIHLDFFEALFTDDPTITNIELIAPKINLERLPSGKSNWTFVQKENELVTQLEEMLIHISDGTIGYTHHEKERVEDIKAISGTLRISQSQVSVEASGINRDIRYGLMSTCYMNSYAHIGSLDAECSAILTSNLFSIDYKGRVIMADGGFQHKGKMTASTADARAWLSLMHQNELHETKTLKGNFIPIAVGMESYSDDKQWIVNINDLVIGNNKGKGTLTYKAEAKQTPELKAQIWFEELNIDELLGDENNDGLFSHEALASEDGFDRSMITDVTLKTPRLIYKRTPMKNASIAGQMLGGEIVLSNARAVLPGEGSIILLGRVGSDKNGVEFTGQVEAHGRYLHDVMPYLGFSEKDIPRSVFGSFRTRFNIIARSESTTISEFRLLLKDKIQIAGGVNLFQGRRPRIEATVGTRYLDFDPFIDAWRNGNSLLVAPEKQPEHPFAFKWLLDVDKEVHLTLELEEYKIVGLKGPSGKLRVSIVDKELSVSGIDVKLARSRIKGKVKLTIDKLDPLPFLDAQLNISRLNLDDAFLTTMRAPAAQENFDGNIWSRRPIDLSPLHYFNGHAELRVRQLKHEKFKASNVRTIVKLENQKLHFQDIKMALWGGDFKGDIQVDSEVVPGYAMSFNVSNGQIREMLSTFVKYKNIAGLFSISGKINFSGVNFQNWLDNVVGHVALDARNIVVQGFNLPAVVRAIGSVRAISGLMNSIRLAADSGATRIGNMNGTTYFNRGGLHTTKITFRSNESVGEVQGMLDFKSWMMDMAVKFGLTPLAQSNYPVLEVKFDGSIDMPERSLNTKSVEAFLARKLR